MKCNQEIHRSLFVQHALATSLGSPAQQGLNSTDLMLRHACADSGAGALGRVDFIGDLGDFKLAPQVGLEPTTLRLTAECSAIELLRSDQAGNCLTVVDFTANS
jgi:hypothetical protein